MLKRLSATVAVLLLAFAQAFAAPQDGPLNLTWGKLIPPEQKAEMIKQRAQLGDRNFLQGGSEPPPPTALDPEAPWMSQKRLQPGTGGLSKVVHDLDGKEVRIGGYVVPLEMNATTVKEFLLVPYQGACIHVPPPPPNQIIYVKSTQGIEITDSFEPVWITGTLRAGTQYTGLAETGYAIDAVKIDPREQ